MKLFIATPMFGAQCAGIYTDSMLRLYDMAARLNFPLQHKFEYGGSLIPILRTNLVHEFLASDATHLIFIDADIGFDPRYIFEMLSLFGSAKYDVLGGTYLKKNIHWNQVISYVQAGKNLGDVNCNTGTYAISPAISFGGHEPVEVDFIGAGFMMIPRETFALFRERYPQYTYGGASRTLYFTSEIQDDVHVSEDVFFCNQVKKAGGKICVCPWMKLSHLGNHVYGGPYNS